MCKPFPRRPLTLIACIPILVLALSGCASVQTRPVTPISKVTSATKSGVGADSIISGIRSAQTTYALRGSDFARLADMGVAAPVLDELQQRFFSEVELLAKRWYVEGLAGGPTRLYPQPVDLDSLASGGDGMAPATNLGKVSDLRRPPGVPEWVPPYPASPFAARISVDEILAMSQGGEPVDRIVTTIQASHIDPLYADSKDLITRTRTGAINGARFAELATRGVAPEVLDALQATYLSDHIERSRLRHKDQKSRPARPNS